MKRNFQYRRDPLLGCGEYRVYAQMECAHPTEDICFFPQVEALDDIHKFYPSSTFLLNVRPVEHWIESMTNWYDIKQRYWLCNIPGANITTGSDDELRRFYLNHNQYIRDFCKKHPSHKLIEFDIESQDAATILNRYVRTTLKFVRMYALLFVVIVCFCCFVSATHRNNCCLRSEFGINTSCWGAFNRCAKSRNRRNSLGRANITVAITKCV
jgi:hypothetical protein